MPTASSGRISLLTANDADRWQQLLARVEHDFYHEAPYHAFCQRRGEGIAHLAHYQEGSSVLLWPYLLRRIDGVDDRYNDVTSVYGYPGPLATDASPSFLRNGWDALTEVWRDQNVVTAFTRLHPLLGNHALLEPVTPAEACGSTVVVDLARPAEEIRRGYGKSLKYRINVARRKGVVVERDDTLRHLPEFVEIYQQTMSRNQASPSYFFDLEYFERLFEAFPRRVHLFTAFHEGSMAAGSVFVETGGIVEYHLSATATEHLHVAPIKLLLDEVRQWAAPRGNRWLHLGGGRGARRDSLFEFKASFSKDLRPFFVWKHVLQSEVYEDLCHGRRDALQTGLHDSNYFPAYRAGAPAA